MVERASQGDEEANPDETSEGLEESRSTTPRDSSLLSRRGLFGRVDARRNIEHGCVNPSLIIDVIKGGTSEKRGEEHDIGTVVQEAG